MISAFQLDQLQVESILSLSPKGQWFKRSLAGMNK